LLQAISVENARTELSLISGLSLCCKKQITQLYAAAGAEFQLALLETLQSKIGDAPVDLGNTRSILELLKTSALTHTKPTVAIYQTIMKQLISLPGPPSPEAMEPSMFVDLSALMFLHIISPQPAKVALTILDLCAIDNVLVLNETWKLFTKLLVKHPQAFSSPLVARILCTLIIWLHRKASPPPEWMQTEAGERPGLTQKQASTIRVFTQFFASHMTTIIRQFGPHLLQCVPYCIKLLYFMR
jgi:hypothetical protein